MKRFLIAVLGTAVTFATVANAATLVATASPDPVLQGAPVTITLVGTTDPENETAQSIDVRIVGAGTEGSTGQAVRRHWIRCAEAGLREAKARYADAS